MGNRQAGEAAPPFAAAAGANSLEQFIRERALQRVDSLAPPQKPPPPLDDPAKVDEWVGQKIADLIAATCEGASEVNLVITGASGLGVKAFCEYIEKAYPHAFVFVDPTRNIDPALALASEAALGSFDEAAFERHVFSLMAYAEKLLYGWRSTQGSMWNPPNRIRVFCRTVRDAAMGHAAASASMMAMTKPQQLILQRLMAGIASFEAAHIRPDRTLHVYLERTCLAGEYAELCKARGHARHGLRDRALSAYVEHRCAAKRALDAYYTSPAALQDPTKLTVQIDEQFSSDDRYRRLVLYESVRTLAHLMDAGLWRNEKRPGAQTLPIVVNQHLNLCAWYGKSSAQLEADAAREAAEHRRATEPRPALQFSDVELNTNGPK